MNRVFRWIFVIVPPLSLLSLAKVPVDIGTAFLHLILGVAFVWSLLSLVLLLIKAVLFRDGDRRDWVIRAVGPLLFVAVQILVWMAHDHSLRAARIFAAETAIAVQAVCDQAAVVPSEIVGWAGGGAGDASSTRFGSRFGSWYPIRYFVNNQAYSVMVRISIDESFVISGGIGKEFDVVYGSDYQRKTLSSAEELMEFAANTPK
ncbi:MAG: hypothetical protein MUE46_16505 [Xanthomonadales bacterium]|jgi:hypothetical protein|nr:hypothetical protein [Xanthomonadales bacterium]